MTLTEEQIQRWWQRQKLKNAANAIYQKRKEEKKKRLRNDL